MIAKLQNNGLVTERQVGKMFEVRVGGTYRDAVETYRDALEPWRDALSRTVDLMSRMNSERAEVASSVRYAVTALRTRHGRPPMATEVLEAVEKWKIRRQPSLTREAMLDALVVLAMRDWIEVDLDEEFGPTPR